MAKRNQNTFLKRQKEIKRQQKALEKMAKRHGQKTQEEIYQEAAAAREQEAAAEETADDTAKE
jgi:hypothetical protein